MIGRETMTTCGECGERLPPDAKSLYYCDPTLSKDCQTTWHRKRSTDPDAIGVDVSTATAAVAAAVAMNRGLALIAGRIRRARQRPSQPT